GPARPGPASLHDRTRPGARTARLQEPPPHDRPGPGRGTTRPEQVPGRPCAGTVATRGNGRGAAGAAPLRRHARAPGTRGEETAATPRARAHPDGPPPA